MSEPTPAGRQDNPELIRLLAELEGQIDSVNAGLARIRNTAARIAVAASEGSDAPASSSIDAYVAAPANRNDWSGAGLAEAPPSTLPAPKTPPPTPVFDAGPPPASHPVAHERDTDHSDTSPAWWNSVAEGASWPQWRTEDAPAAASEPASEPTWEPEPISSHPKSAFNPSDEWAAPLANELAPGADATPDSAAMFASADETPEDAEALLPAPLELADPQAGFEADAAWTSEEPSKESMSGQPSRSLEGGMPGPLSKGWPDESAWSQSFEWPAIAKGAQKPAGFGVTGDDETREEVSDIVARVRAELEGAPEPSVSDATGDDETREEVSDIVARVRAELDAAQAAGREQELPPFDDATETAGDCGSAEAPASADQPEQDDAAKRDAVSRAVEEIRNQLAAGGLDVSGSDASGDEDTAHAPGGEPHLWDDDAALDSRPEPDAGLDGDRPAFRLAAPGAFPDWSQVSVELSGPPVVVMKDADGRVELASVYETLHALGCGDGAALLNYTPHSVTVGLPITSQFPSKEQVAEAVEKVFGLTSRVESDGVRITVSIGEDPQRKSVGAA